MNPVDKLDVEELRAAAIRLRVELPPHWRHTPRLVQTDSEGIDGVAFCPKTHETSGEYEFADCDWCEVIETHHEKLATLITALLLAREPLAAWLEAEAARWHITNANLYERGTGAFSGFCSCGASVVRPNRDVPAQCGRLSRALAVARVINGGGR